MHSCELTISSGDVYWVQLVFTTLDSFGFVRDVDLGCTCNHQQVDKCYQRWLSRQQPTSGDRDNQRVSLTRWWSRRQPLVVASNVASFVVSSIPNESYLIVGCRFDHQWALLIYTHWRTSQATTIDESLRLVGGCMYLPGDNQRVSSTRWWPK